MPRRRKGHSGEQPRRAKATTPPSTASRKPSSVTLSGGLVVSVDDFVYLSPESTDEPYYIGRVMEFVTRSRAYGSRRTLLQQQDPSPTKPQAPSGEKTATTGGGNAGAPPARRLSSRSTSRTRTRPSYKEYSTDEDDEEGDMAGHEKTETKADASDSDDADFVSQAGMSGIQVRIAWFQRPRDLPNTRLKTKDPKLLVATMHTDLNPVTAIRGKCHAKHSSEIDSLEQWKRMPDHFYYNQLFDRYIMRLYDIVPVSRVVNVPEDVRQKLLTTYKFVITEPSKVSELTDSRRACVVCSQWCASPESMNCSTCKQNYHMRCLDPPLTKKPSKGYGWQCVSCLKRLHEQRLQEEKARQASQDRTRSSAGYPKSSMSDTSSRCSSPPPRPLDVSTAPQPKKPRLESPVSAAGDEINKIDEQLSHVSIRKKALLWPFRYFGIYSNMEDVLNDDERIYPRAASRIGSKYQAHIPDVVPSSENDSGTDGLRQRITQSEASSVDMDADQRSVTRSETTPGPQEFGSIRSPVFAGLPQRLASHKNSRAKRTKSYQALSEAWNAIEASRGNDDDGLIFKMPGDLDEEELDLYFESVVPYLQSNASPEHNYTLLDAQEAALRMLSERNYDTEEVLQMVDELKNVYIKEKPQGECWTEATRKKFFAMMREHGSNLEIILKNMAGMSRSQLTLYYYLNRPTEQGKQALGAFEQKHYQMLRRSLGQGEAAAAAAATTTTAAAAAAVNPKANANEDGGEHVGESGSMTSTNVSPTDSPRHHGGTSMTTRDHASSPSQSASAYLRCLNCHRERASRWFPAPMELKINAPRTDRRGNMARHLICGDCRDHWCRYASMPSLDTIHSSLISNGAASRGSNKSGQINAKKKDDDAKRRGGIRGPIQIPKSKETVPWAALPCDVCRCDIETDADHIMHCEGCGLCVHNYCYGYDISHKAGKKWKCDMCLNVSTPTASIVPMCMICRKVSPERPYQAMWHTSGFNWAHVICALSMPETTFCLIDHKRVVNGIPAIPPEAWTNTCSICKVPEGAVISSYTKSSDGDEVQFAHPWCAFEASKLLLVTTLDTPPQQDQQLHHEQQLQNSACHSGSFTSSHQNITVVLAKKDELHPGVAGHAFDDKDPSGRPFVKQLVNNKRMLAPPGRGALQRSALTQNYTDNSSHKRKASQVSQDTAISNNNTDSITATISSNSSSLVNPASITKIINYTSLDNHTDFRDLCDSQDESMAALKRVIGSICSASCSRCSTDFSPYWRHINNDSPSPITPVSIKELKKGNVLLPPLETPSDENGSPRLEKPLTCQHCFARSYHI